MSALVTLAGDGTFHPATTPSEVEDPPLAALTRLRSLLGEAPEEQIATRMYLPAALGTERVDHLLPATLTLLAETSGDLAAHGWRIGTGAGVDWLRATELRDRMLGAARIALLGDVGPLEVTVLGPATLAAATYLPGGERTLADRGALRELPQLLAGGLAEHLAAVREHVPGAAVRVLIRESAAAALVRGMLPTASGYQRHPALAPGDLGRLWQDLLEHLLPAASLRAEEVTLGLSLADVPDAAGLLEAARTAGFGALALAPEQVGSLTGAGRRAWEMLAGLRDAGLGIDLLLSPGRIESTLERVADTWRELGYGPRDLAGFVLRAHRPSTAADPAAAPGVASLLAEH
ncbi:MAG: hypothetical protein Q4G40_09800, partial [Brachybacterium sp.]|nr:hypothetical protein [Brachybacterium sp.]